MRALVVYESMYGNTHEIAEAIAEGLRAGGVDGPGPAVVAAHDAGASELEGVDLLVVGGPTHVHGMSRESTRHTAVEAAHKPGHELPLEPDAEGPGVREWFAARPTPLGPACGAAFDTRMHGPAALTGRASKGIARLLHKHGVDEAVAPESFLVERDNTLTPGERDRAVAWGRDLATQVRARLSCSA